MRFCNLEVPTSRRPCDGFGRHRSNASGNGWRSITFRTGDLGIESSFLVLTTLPRYSWDGVSSVARSLTGSRVCCRTLGLANLTYRRPSCSVISGLTLVPVVAPAVVTERPLCVRNTPCMHPYGLFHACRIILKQFLCKFL